MNNKIIQKVTFLAHNLGVSLNISDLNQINQIYEIVNNTPDIREDKINKLKQSITAGNYKPPYDKITSCFIRNNLEFDLLIQSIPPGEDYYNIYHKLCSILVCDIFSDELTNPKIEIQTIDRSKRFDLLLYNRANAGFWKHMRASHKITHVIFEFKNREKDYHTEFAGQIARYSSKNRAVILVTRSEPKNNIFQELRDLFIKFDSFLPLAISDKKFNLALKMKKHGLSPSNIFVEPYLRLQIA
jgi:hypothetical protein